MKCTSEFLSFAMVKLLKEEAIWKNFGVNLAIAICMILKLSGKFFYVVYCQVQYSRNCIMHSEILLHFPGIYLFFFLEVI